MKVLLLIVARVPVALGDTDTSSLVLGLGWRATCISSNDMIATSTISIGDVHRGCFVDADDASRAAARATCSDRMPVASYSVILVVVVLLRVSTCRCCSGSRHTHAFPLAEGSAHPTVMVSSASAACQVSP